MAKSNPIHCQQNLINYQKLRVGGGEMSIETENLIVNQRTSNGNI